MALLSDFNKSRGLDPRAMATLDAKKNSRAARENDLKRKQAEREINAVRALLNVVDRELQRLSVSGRRYHADEARAEQEFEQEARKFTELTKELERHSDKIKELNAKLGAKRISTTRVASKRDFGSINAGKEVQRLKDDLRKVDQEIEHLNAKKRRMYSEISAAIQKMEQAQALEQRAAAELHEGEDGMEEIISEIKSEESMLGRFKARFSVEQRNLATKKKELESVKNRMKGTDSGSPALLNEKQKLEQKIRELEKNLN
jgi:chromosome segregation ATPase